MYRADQVLPEKLTYRAEIDGLRSIAVVSVILYHAQLEVFNRDWFQGGYVGVDVFFVISGYLITRIILFELYRTGSFSFKRFYERRARRILPVLFLVILVSIPVAWIKLLPQEITEYSRSILSSIFFGSNFYFHAIQTSYGAESALLKPFLHTWSLGVEEQFYLVFPVFLLLSFRFFKEHVFFLILFLSIASLVMAQYLAPIRPELNFYLPFTRFWELAVGSMLAYRELIHRNVVMQAAWSELLSWSGLGLVVYSILFFDGQTLHPGFYTLIPVLGVSLVIYFGSATRLVLKLLASKLMVAVGLISYSAYLWHFPIFAFARVRDSSITNMDKFGLIVLTLALSLASYWIIEKPFRRRISGNVFHVSLGLAFVAIVLPLSYSGFHNGFEKFWERNAPEDLVAPYDVIRDALVDQPLRTGQCRFNFTRDKLFIDVSERINECRELHGRAVFLLGDSHAVNIFNVLNYSGQYPFVVGSVQGGCRPHRCFRGRPNQYDYFLESLLPQISENDVIIFHQSGSHLIQDARGKNDSQRAFDSGEFRIDEANVKQVVEFLDKIASKTSAPVIWLGAFMEYRFSPKTIVERSLKGESYDKYLSIHANSAFIFSELDKELGKIASTAYQYVSFRELFEVENSAEIAGLNGERCFQFRDKDHFSTCGERTLGERGNFEFISF